MTPQQEAATIFRGVVDHLAHRTPQLKPALQQSLHACQIVGWNDARDWFDREIIGYPLGLPLPPYRRVSGRLVWTPEGMPDFSSASIQAGMSMFKEVLRLKEEGTVLDVTAGVDWILGAASLGYAEYSGETSTIEPAQSSTRTSRGLPLKLTRVKRFEAYVFADVIRRIQHITLKFASDRYAFLAFTEALSDICQGYRQQVDAKLHALNFGNHIEAIQNGIRSQNPQDWRQAVYGCRNLFEDLGRLLWQDPRTTYDLLPGSAKNGKLQVTQDKYLNRLSAYLHQQAISKNSDKFPHDELERLKASIHSLASDASSGHGEISLVDARQVVIATYFILGALVTKTDMAPVVSYKSTIGKRLDDPAAANNPNNPNLHTLQIENRP